MQIDLNLIKEHGEINEWREAFNEKLGPFGISRQTFYKWRNGRGKDSRVLKLALDAYPPEDWRHEFAKKELEKRQAQAVEQ